MAESVAKSYTTGHGSSGKVRIWLSIVRYHRAQTDLMARSLARYAADIAARVEGDPSAKVLDLGCGGRAGVVLGLGALGIPAVGIDYDAPEPRISPRGWLRVARRNGVERAVKTATRQLVFDRPFYRGLEKHLGASLRWDELDVRAGDAHALDFEDDTFSYVFSATVFEHIADVEKAAAELRRVLRPGGEAYIVAHLYPSPSGGHALDWAGLEPPVGSPVPAWDHLRENRFPAHVFLNKLRADEYMAAFRRHFEVLSEEYETEGLDLLTPGIRAELADWSTEDLTRRVLKVRLAAPTS